MTKGSYYAIQTNLAKNVAGAWTAREAVCLIGHYMIRQVSRHC